MYRLVPKLWTTEHSGILPRHLSKEQAIAHSLADSNALSASVCSPVLTPLLKLGMLKKFLFGVLMKQSAHSFAAFTEDMIFSHCVYSQFS
jgi:hypothetical protein